MDLVKKLRLSALGAFGVLQLGGCGTPPTDKNGNTKQEYFSYDEKNTSASLVTVLRNHDTHTTVTSKAPALEVRTPDSMGGQTDSVKGRSYAVFHPERYYGRSHIDAYMNEMKEWHYNKAVVTGADTISVEVYKQQLVRGHVPVQVQ